MEFKELNIIDPILKAIEYVGYETPSSIQEKAIPILLSGKDLIGCAQTGTGKTAAFAVPILQKIYEQRSNGTEKRKLKALIITPTRELALQISESFKTYGRYTGLKTTVIFGGVSQKPQVSELQSGTDILIATPGRLNDLLNQKLLSLNEVSMLVLDEADQMLDMGFIRDVRKIINQLPNKRQTLLFSATMPKEIAALASTILHNPVTVSVTPVSSTVESIDQMVYFVDKANKGRLLIKLMQNKEIVSVLVFSRTKHGANKIDKILNGAGIAAKPIHGNKSQTARQSALSDFKSGKIRVLVATDIAARGIDINQLSHVINYDLPNTPETYIHRIGRTGRAGLSGTAISFCDYDEKAYLKDIEKLIKKDIREVENHTYPMQIFEHSVPETRTRLSRAERDAKSAAKSQKSTNNSNHSHNKGIKSGQNSSPQGTPKHKLANNTRSGQQKRNTKNDQHQGTKRKGSSN